MSRVLVDVGAGEGGGGTVTYRDAHGVEHDETCRHAPVLPPVPEDTMLHACAALRYFGYPADVRVPTEDYEAPYYVQAVYPHLAAAVLRWAADDHWDEIEGAKIKVGELGATHVCLHTQDQVVNWLRGLADEVAP